jgi:SOS-response transcriptional repressor LexA
MLRGIKGTYIYACDPALNEYLANHITKFKTEKVVNYLPASEVKMFENSIPVYDLKVAAGNFSELQNVNDVKWIELPTQYKPSKELFACKVIGESMNKIIPNGALCLFKKDPGGSRNGKIVLIEHTSIQEDSGSRYTIKEYHSKKNIENDQWSHQSIILKPLSNNMEFINIEITEDELSSLKVVGIFECVL